MSCLGVHFSLSAEEVQRLRDIEDEYERLNYLKENIEEEYFAEHEERMVQSDKAWDAMHRTLADGLLTDDGGEYPLNHVILGGEDLYTAGDYIMVLKTPGQVRDVAVMLPHIDEAEFRRRYFAIDADDYGPGEDDFGYTWSNFEDVRSFWLRAASEGRFVLFTADQ